MITRERESDQSQDGLAKKGLILVMLGLIQFAGPGPMLNRNQTGVCGMSVCVYMLCICLYSVCVCEPVEHNFQEGSPLPLVDSLALFCHAVCAGQATWPRSFQVIFRPLPPTSL